MSTKRPVRILQFGEGNFLRAFADWMIDIACEKGVMDCSVAVVPPRFHTGRGIEALKRQGGAYHVVLEGMADGEARRDIRRIECVADAFAPEAEPETYDRYVCSPDLRFVISNTTEAGIAYQPETLPAAEGTYPASFPGKVTAMLYRRFLHFGGDISKGLIFICCELIDNNGQQLRRLVLRHAEENNLGTEFVQWVQLACIFCDSLVDRIVSGFPTDKIEELRPAVGDDQLVVCGEMYHLWVIAGIDYEQVAREFPLHKAGLHVEFLPSCAEFREKKVRILNGCHTTMTPVALLMGLETVREAFTNDIVHKYITQMVEREVLPVIDNAQLDNAQCTMHNAQLDNAQCTMHNAQLDDVHCALKSFADGILERFLNPYIRHRLESIALNSLSKWEARCWPTVRDVYNKQGRLATHAIFGFAALQTLYASDNFIPQDTDLARKDEYAPRFEQEVPGFTALVEQYMRDIKEQGIQTALMSIL